VNLIIVILTGGLLFTGATFTTSAAWFEGKAKLSDAIRVMAISWVGNLLGGIIFALFTDACGMVSGGMPAGAYALKLSHMKISGSFMTTMFRGIGCNWMVCMAVYLSNMAQDVMGKYIVTLLCISTFVAIGFEHYPANAYTLPVGYLAGAQMVPPDFMTPSMILFQNLLPASVGNLISGSLIMALGYSFLYGRIGKLIYGEKH